MEAATNIPVSPGACAELTGLQVAAGFVTWMNFLQLLAIVGVVVCLTYLAFRSFGHLLRAFASVPIVVYEAVGFGVSLALVAVAGQVDGDQRTWPLLGGSLLFGGMVWASAKLRGVKGSTARFCALLTVVWGTVAVLFLDQTVGFIAVAALLGALGFGVSASPLSYAVGFRDEDSVAPTTLAAVAILAAYAVGKAVGMDNDVVAVFEPGALWVGGFVSCVGMLIVSSKWYARPSTYAFRQVLAVLVLFGAVAFGNLLGLREVAGLGATFLVLYLIEKPFEIPARSVTAYMAIGLVVFGLLGGAVWWAQSNMALVEPYLLF